MQISKERIIEIAREAGLVYNEDVHPNKILLHHRKALYEYARILSEELEAAPRFYTKSFRENLDENEDDVGKT